MSQLEKERKKVRASENIVDMRSNAERRPRKAGSEPDHGAFVRMGFTVMMTSFRIGAGFTAC